MDFAFSEEQEQLRAAARDVLAAESPPAVVRAAADDAADPEAWRPLWKTLVDLGWTGLTLPESAGGAGLGVVDLIALTEVAGRHLLPAPFVSSVVLAAPVLADVAAGHEVLRAIVAGEPASLAAEAPGTSGRSGDPFAGVSITDGAVSGEKVLVTDGPRASWLVVTGRDADGQPAVAVVDTAAEGLRVEPTASVDPSRPLADVRFDEVAADTFTADAAGGLAVARTGLAAELVGVADRALELAVEHARTRQQFGRAIGSFQGVKHRLADAWLAVERARTLTYRAAMLVGEADAGGGADERDVAVAMAKGAASETAVSVCKDVIQVFGAIATTWEHDAHLFLRRARQSAALLGDARHHLRAVGAAVAAGR